MTICDFCRRTVLESNKTWGYHHVNATEFDAAAKSGCVFCRKLSASVGVLDDIDDTTAFYRWSIRETAQIRETKSYISITFRPVPGRGKGLPEVRFDMLPEDDLGPIPNGNMESFGLRTDSEASQAKMKSWLEDCVANHSVCKARQANYHYMPTRVLDIGAPGSPWPPSHIRIVHTKDIIEDEKKEYMTLSHCWGKEPFVQLTAKDFLEFTTVGIPWKNSPRASPKDIYSNKNFVEAIETTRKLGIQYIWIDSLCIIQHSKEDWNTEAKLMHKVYRNSYCNLAAVDSEDCHGGLFRDRNYDVLPSRYVPGSSSHRFGGRNWRVLSSELWDEVLLGGPLYTRGWVFQERMLSPRLLQFGQDQMFWDCATISACEALPAGLPLSLDSKAAKDRHWRQRLQEAEVTVKAAESSLEKLWERSVHTYTSCKLTKHSDKEDAIWGIAKLMRDMLRQEYAHGLWSAHLEVQLAWRVKGRPKVAQPKEEKTDPEKGKLFPHWSWTYLDVPIQVIPRFRDDRRFYVATNHEGGKVSFEFEKPYSGWLKTEGFPRDKEQLGNIATKPFNAEEDCGKAQVDTRWKPDECSKLKSRKIAIQAHICQGTLRFVHEKDGWVVDIDGVSGDAVIEAFPDVQSLQNEAVCNFLVLAASIVFMDELEREVMEEEAVDAQYSGIGILVERNDEDQLQRVGAIEFRQMCWHDWNYFRRACSEDDETIGEDELRPENGKKIWLI
ncbi:HET-domain-containing protein [Colletotrichum eremochloae]|nr:HET-domain-containing protein [Colletotrichum eremochloae]